jgi:NAD(P)-dependent dehydrogenase (short-subunit alcohol dehydrogenase family)
MKPDDRRPELGRSEGKAALVTGASSGLGAHFAELLARHGRGSDGCGPPRRGVRAVCDHIANEGGRAIRW